MILLGITIDNKLVFKKHIENFCRTAQYKLHALTRIRKYLALNKTILLGNTFINSQFKGAQFLVSESPLKGMKNAFYFTLETLSVLKIFKFLS